jgi:hypothetical protein
MNTEEDEFIAEAEGPEGIFGVFEDDGRTGYLYLYQPYGCEIFRWLPVYNRRASLPIHPNDVQVVWSKDLFKVGVKIWGRMYAIYNLETDWSIRYPITTSGIEDPVWLNGFAR